MKKKKKKVGKGDNYGENACEKPFIWSSNSLLIIIVSTARNRIGSKPNYA